MSGQLDELRRRGQHAEALELARRLCDLTRQHRGADHPDFAATLVALAELHGTTGQYQPAEQFYQQALAIHEAVPRPDEEAIGLLLGNLAGLYQTIGDYAAAEPLYRRSIEVLRRARGEEDLILATTLSSLAVLCQRVGDYTGAEGLLMRSLEIRGKALGEGHEAYATSLHDLAALYMAVGRFEAAEDLLRRVIEIRSLVLPENHPELADGLNDLGALLSAAFRDEHSLDERDERLSEAETLLRRALEIRLSVFGENHLSVAESLGNLAGWYRAVRHYGAAEGRLIEAVGIARRVLGPDHPQLAIALNNLAALFLEMGQPAEAEPLYTESLRIIRASLGDSSAEYVSSLHNLAALYAASGREAAALDLMEEAARLEDQMVGRILAIGSESARMAYLRMLQCGVDAVLSLVLRHYATSAPAVGKALDLVLRRKAVVTEAMAIPRDAVLERRYPGLQGELKELAALRLQIARKALAGPGAEGPAAHRQLLGEWKDRKERLESELAGRIPEMNLERVLRAADRRAVALALPEDAALVEFVRFDVFDFTAVLARGERLWTPCRYIAFILRAGEPDQARLVDLGEAEPIDQMIAGFRRWIAGGLEGGDDPARGEWPADAAGPAGIDDGSTLRAALFTPLVAALGDRTRLLLAPDGDLARLPFEVLPMDDGRRLIDEYRISYLGAGRDVLRFGATSATEAREPVVLADPDFALAAPPATAGPEPPSSRETRHAPAARRPRDLDGLTLQFPPLRQTRAEGECIGGLLGVRPWLEGAALKARLKACRSPGILHLATHGFFLADQERDAGGEARIWPVGVGMGRVAGPELENPLLRAGLALAGANTWLEGGHPPLEAEDGLLTAEDVSGLDLLATDLVVLSACETGVGDVRTGEGVFGLRRAFVLAGAKTLVMSLWRVPDRQRETLMAEFYRRLLDGCPRADALRDAQLALKAEHEDPYFWGAFICQGGPAPLPPDRS